MKAKIIFKDSIDDSEISLSTSRDNDNYILTITAGDEDDAWFSPKDFLEFIHECQQFYADNEKRKDELPQGEKE